MGDYTDRTSNAELDDNAMLAGKTTLPKHQVGEIPPVSTRPMNALDEMNDAMNGDDDESGGPTRTKTGGRQKGTPNKVQRVDIQKACRLFSLRAVSTLVEIMENEKENGATRVAAANAILDRAHGKPKQMTEISGVDGEAIQTSLRIEFVGQPPIRASVDAQITDKAGDIIDMQLETVRVPENRRPWDPA